MGISIDKYVAFPHKAIKVRTHRMEVLAGNLANANTPGYKAKDIAFKQAMENANYARAHNLNRTHEKHFDAGLKASDELMYRIPNQPDTGDGNTVDVQTERNKFLDNGLRYQASIQFLDGRFKGFKKAISGGQS